MSHSKIIRICVVTTILLTSIKCGGDSGKVGQAILCSLAAASQDNSSMTVKMSQSFLDSFNLNYFYASDSDKNENLKKTIIKLKVIPHLKFHH